MIATGCPPELLFRPDNGGDTPEDLANEYHNGNAASALRLLRRLLQPAAGPACCSAAAAAALLVADAPGLRAALAAEEREAHRAGGRRPGDQLARLAAAVAAGDAPPGSLPCVALAEECALVAAQQRLALAVALFASGSRLKRRGFVRESPSAPGALLPGLAAVLSKDDKAARLYDVLVGSEDQPVPPPGTAVGMMPALAPVAVAERAAAEGGWAWQAAQVRAEVAQLRAELGV